MSLIKQRSLCFLVSVSLLFSLLTGCGSGASGGSAAASSNEAAASTSHRQSRETVLSPSPDGRVVTSENGVTVDCSNTSDGYCMVLYEGSSEKVKVQITDPADNTYSYTLLPGHYGTFPLSGGDGHYHLEALEHAFDNLYALSLSEDFDVTIEDEFAPFLYPNQYVWFTEDSQAVALAKELSDASADDLDFVARVYDYVINNISYDNELALSVQPDYLPDIDRTLTTKKGICFDYASFMGALLRSQGIPTRLEVGYAGAAYHAWISVYLSEIGWVSNIIEFDGVSWRLMDPTLGAGNSARDVAKYIGDGSNYIVKFSY